MKMMNDATLLSMDVPNIGCMHQGYNLNHCLMPLVLHYVFHCPQMTFVPDACSRKATNVVSSVR